MLNQVVFTISLESSEAKFLSLPPTGELGSAGHMTQQAFRAYFLFCYAGIINSKKSTERLLLDTNKRD